MTAKNNLLQNYDDIEEHEGDQERFLSFDLLQKCGLIHYGWSLAGVLSRSRSQQGIGRREAVPLPYSSDTQFENTHVPGTTDETSDTELVVNRENTAVSSGKKLPDVVSVASCSDIGTHKRLTREKKPNTTAMSKSRKPMNKRTVSFDEKSTRPRLTKDENVDDGDGDVGGATARRRARSSGYYTGGSRESDGTDTEVFTPEVFTPSPAPPVQDDLGPQFPSTAGHEVAVPDTQCTSSSSDDISEDGEDPTVEAASDVRNSLDTSESSFMLSSDFSMLRGEETIEDPEVEPSEPAGIQQLESPVDTLEAQRRTPLGPEDMAEILLETLAPDPILDENDQLLAQFRREIDEDNIRRMIREGVPFEHLEEIIASRLPSDIDLSPETVPTENPAESHNVDEKIASRLQMAAQCDIHDCDFLPCIQGQQELAALEKYLETRPASPSCYENEKLRYLSDHDCEDELRCTVPWCQFIWEFCRIHRSEDAIPLERLRQSLYQKYFSGCHDIFNISSQHCEVIQLQDESSGERPNCEVLTRLAPYKDVFLAIDLIASPAVSANHCVIKKLPCYEDSQVDVDLLRRLIHPHIVTHHWLRQNLYPKTVILCTQFHGDSVCDWLRRRHPDGCHSRQLIQTILSHLLSAVKYLHSVNILYLAWTGSDVVLGCPCGDVIHAKLCDFSHAVSMEGELSEENEEVIRQLLLPAIVPPERTLSLDHSDQWGLGCLLYEIALGYKVHHASVHEEPETQRQAAEQMPDLRDLESVDPVVASVIRDCLQMPVGERPTIAQLQQRRLDV